MSFYISKEQMDKRLENTSLQVVKEVKEPRTNNKIAYEDRVLAGILANTSDDSQKEIADALGIKQQQVSNSKKGLISNATYDKELKKEIDEASNAVLAARKPSLDRAKDLALDNLCSALEEVSLKVKNETIEAKELSKISVDMAKILDKANPNGSSKGAKVLIINAPSMSTVSDYSKVVA